jgi:CRISPR-associated protein Csb1
MPYIRCVTGAVDAQGKLTAPEVVVTSFTEGHRIASTYFLEGEQLKANPLIAIQAKQLRDKAKEIKAVAKNLDAEAKKNSEKEAKSKEEDAKRLESNALFQNTLIQEFGIVLPTGKKAHPPAEKWWDVFKTIFKYDPNALVHGVLFPQWNIKIPRFLTAHLEAFGASRVDRSGVKFDRLGKTPSGQPIFAVDDATAREIRATFILDVSLVRSFGRIKGNKQLGLNEKQKEFLVALALWKINRLLAAPFRFRSGCHLRCLSLRNGEIDLPIPIEIDIRQAITDAAFEAAPRITDTYWPRDEIYREGKDEKEEDAAADDNDVNGDEAVESSES